MSVQTDGFGSILRGVADQSSLTQTDWYINATTGDDANDGKTAETAVKTHAEVERRLQGGTVFPPVDPDSYGARVVRIHLLTDLPSSDPVNVRCKLGVDVVILYLGGVKQVLRTGTITSLTAKNRATNVPWSVADSGGDLSSYVGKRFRVTSGPRVNTTAWVAKSIGGGAVRLSNPVIPMGTDPQTLIDWDYVNVGWALLGVTENTTQLSLGDAYAIEELRTANLGIVDVQTSGVSQWWPATIVYFQDLNFDTTRFQTSELHVYNGWTHFIGCSVTHLLYAAGGEHKFINCHLQLGIFGQQYNLNIHAGLIGKTSTAFGSLGVQGEGGPITLLYDTMFQGTGMRGDNIIISRACVFDSISNGNNQHGAGVYAGGSNSGAGKRGSVRLTNVHMGDAGAAALWGSGNAGGGVEVFADSSFIYDIGSTLSITGTGGDFILAGATTARSWNEGSGAYASAAATTWANLASTDNAHNVAKNAHIIGIVP